MSYLDQNKELIRIMNSYQLQKEFSLWFRFVERVNQTTLYLFGVGVFYWFPTSSFFSLPVYGLLGLLFVLLARAVHEMQEA
tara:strand:- start:523 stop:765 length:243 start_codon:yes stop_codon:yes gene_type:complete